MECFDAPDELLLGSLQIKSTDFPRAGGLKMATREKITDAAREADLLGRADWNQRRIFEKWIQEEKKKPPKLQRAPWRVILKKFVFLRCHFQLV